MPIDTNLQKVVEYLVATEQQIGLGAMGQGQRPWLDFLDLGAVGQFDFAGLHNLLNRDDANNQYAQLTAQEDGKSKDLFTAKLSGDYLGGLERDLQMRRRSRVRLFVHGGARSVAQGSNKGPLRTSTIDWMTRLLEDTKEGGQ